MARDLCSRDAKISDMCAFVTTLSTTPISVVKLMVIQMRDMVLCTLYSHRIVKEGARAATTDAARPSTHAVPS